MTSKEKLIKIIEEIDFWHKAGVAHLQINTVLATVINAMTV